ncbi:hypothetical protein SAMN03097699_1768 [Flavobacteriaceae bacterium MAR_2010_188]|nr:hypothetical protein SAMN03097699_1768 [Flavobacteriaceae bacterium MAR_2010_188]
MTTLFKQTKRIIALNAIILITACSPDERPATIDASKDASSDSFLAKRSAEKLNIFKGPVVEYGSGKARSWISINGEGYPVEIGIELTQSVFEDLSLVNIGHVESTVLPLHQKAKELTPFEHLGLNYQPEGHGPVFWAEHIDFHFYTITNEERMLIPPYDSSDPANVAAFNYFPDRSKMPLNYMTFPGPGGVYAMMGKHWVPQDWQTGYNPFTHVMILGTYEQKNVFIEPMVTVDYLLSGGEFSGNYSQPQTFEEPGNNYPTKYNIYHDGKKGNIYITLSEFVTR